MPTVEMELDRTPDETPKPRAEATARVTSRDSDSQHDRFSPDPNKRTDRYRLVTPYEHTLKD